MYTKKIKINIQINKGLSLKFHKLKSNFIFIMKVSINIVSPNAHVHSQDRFNLKEYT